MMLIGLSGIARSGKDTVAAVLRERHGFHVSAFADPMRSITAAIDPIIGIGEDGPIRYNEALAQYGYNDAKLAFPELRQFLQRLGTEAGRDLFGADHWVELWRKQHGAVRAPGGTWSFRHDRIAIADCRFLNEAAAIREMGGVVVRVHRPGITPPNGHASETELARIEPDLRIDNDADLDELAHQVDSLVAAIERMTPRQVA